MDINPQFGAQRQGPSLLFDEDERQATGFRKPDVGRHLFKISKIEDRESGTNVTFEVVDGTNAGRRAFKHFTNKQGKRKALVQFLFALGVDPKLVTAFKAGKVRWVNAGRTWEASVLNALISADVKHEPHYNVEKKAAGHTIADLNNFDPAPNSEPLANCGKPVGEVSSGLDPSAMR